jgi:LysM repeat protein
LGINTIGNVGVVRVRAAALFAMLAIGASFTGAEAQSLRGSTRSLDLQNREARDHDFTFLTSRNHVERFAEAGYLVSVPRSTRDYEVKRGVVPYARPEVAMFISRLGGQYRAACGEKLVVTSLVRPLNRQPRNASPRTVHPTGMALDLRRSANPACRSWLESVLLSLEGDGVLEAVRERRPPHYHVAVFPKKYAAYVETLETRTASAEADAEYRVRRGDSLWKIAQAHGTTVSVIRSANDLRGSRIYAGQVLTVPTGR